MISEPSDAYIRTLRWMGLLVLPWVQSPGSPERARGTGRLENEAVDARPDAQPTRGGLFNRRNARRYVSLCLH
jgi:hypothetical protein